MQAVLSVVFFSFGCAVLAASIACIGPCNWPFFMYIYLSPTGGEGVGAIWRQFGIDEAASCKRHGSEACILVCVVYMRFVSGCM